MKLKTTEQFIQDAIKILKFFCQKNNVKLIRISYKDKNKIKQILKEKINNV